MGKDTILTFMVKIHTKFNGGSVGGIKCVCLHLWSNWFIKITLQFISFAIATLHNILGFDEYDSRPPYFRQTWLDTEIVFCLEYMQKRWKFTNVSYSIPYSVHSATIFLPICSNVNSWYYCHTIHNNNLNPRTPLSQAIERELVSELERPTLHTLMHVLTFCLI